jgi:hypothetical protein
MPGVNMVPASAQGQGSVFTSSTGNVVLGRDSQMLLVTGASGSAQGAGAANVGNTGGRTTRNVAASGSASGSAGASTGQRAN